MSAITLIKVELSDGGFVLIHQADFANWSNWAEEIEGKSCPEDRPCLDDETLRREAVAVFNPDGSLYHLRRLADLPDIADFVERAQTVAQMLAEPISLTKWKALLSKNER